MRSVRVFIVDDDLDFGESLAIILEGQGCEVTTASSGEEAVEIFRDEDFDIAFMDVRLPGINGIESFLEIRKFKPYAKVVMMTGYSVQDLLKQAVDNGAWGILNKPLDVNNVLQFVEKVRNGGILITDDDPDFVASLKDLFEEEGWKVHTCADGEQALDFIRENGVCALILDLRMPVLDGLETYSRLKAEGFEVPTIIVTAYADQEPEAMAELNRLAVTGILRKPFEPSHIIEALKKIRETEQG
jgi:two-component system response regulator HydG